MLPEGTVDLQSAGIWGLGFRSSGFGVLRVPRRECVGNKGDRCRTPLRMPCRHSGTLRRSPVRSGTAGRSGGSDVYPIRGDRGGRSGALNGTGTVGGRCSTRDRLARPQGIFGVVYADPVVCEPQFVLRPYRGHVAGRARPSGSLAADRCRRQTALVAIDAASAVASVLRRQRTMRIVAAHACEGLSAGLHAGAPRKIDGLVPYVPGVAPVDHLSGRRRRPVAGAAVLEQLVARQAHRIHDGGSRLLQRSGLHCLDVLSARPVAGFAADPQLARPQREPVSKRQGPSRMALEAAHDRGLRAEGLVVHAQRFGGSPDRNIAMPRRRAQRSACRVVAEVMLDIATLVDLSDKGDGLLARAERPLEARVDSLALRCDLDAETAFAGAIRVPDAPSPFQGSRRRERRQGRMIGCGVQRESVPARRLPRGLLAVAGRTCIRPQV